MDQPKFILEPYNGIKTRYHCPNCQRREKTFSLYIDLETGEHIHSNVGRCNRESNCGYHYTPKQFFQDNNISIDNSPLIKQHIKPKVVQPKAASLIPGEIFKASLKNYQSNNFVTYLISLFGIEITNKLISKYFIGPSKHWGGSTVFWQIDISGKIRTGKIMLYNPISGKRVKEPFNHIHWAHKAFKELEFELKQCLFGEHLLRDNTKPIAVVESEKTAIISSVYLPQFTWLATGSLTNLNAEKCLVLKDQTVFLFPDLNAYEKWGSKSKILSHLSKFIVSDLLELKATTIEREQGFDLADYLIKYDYKKFIE